MANILKKNTWTIELEKLPAYVEWNGDWKYELDGEMIKLILECDELDEFGNQKITDVMKTHFKRNVVNRMRNGVLHIRWAGRKGGLGRRYSDKDPEDKYAKSSCNLGVHSKYIKNTMYAFMGWIDYDMVAGHPTILCEINKLVNKKTLPALQNYIDNRDTILQSIIDYYSVKGDDDLETALFRITRNEAKDLFNLTIYGGGFSTWEKQLAEGNAKKGTLPKPVAKKDAHPDWLAYKKEINDIIDVVYLSNPELADKVCKGEKNKDGKDLELWERKNRTMSYFCGIIENDCLKWAYKYGIKNNLFPERSGDLCYDGFTMPPPPLGINLDEQIIKMNEFIAKKTGLAVKMAVKGFEKVVQSIIDKRNTQMVTVTNAIPVAETEVDSEVASVSSTEYVFGIIDDEKEARDLIMTKLKHRLIFSKGSFYYKLNNNVWTCGQKKIESCVFNYVMECNLKKYNAKGDLVPYSRQISNATSLTGAILKYVTEYNADDALYDKFVTTTKGRLCFEDGVLDFITKSFYKWDEVDFEYYTPIQIPRKIGEYINNPNNELKDKIKADIFEPLFGKNCERALRFLARGLAGHIEDKHWGKYIGNRNCGKGVFETLLRYALGDYYTSVEPANFLVNANRQLKSEQVEKQMAFALDFMFARICCSQEMPPPTKNNTIKLNGDIFKKLCSGGDRLKGKRNFDIYITEFINQARLILMCNDCPPLTNDDALETCFEFDNVVQFISREEYEIYRNKYKKQVDAGDMTQEIMDLLMERYKIGDPNIKTLCASVEYSNAFIHLMCMSYGDKQPVNDVEKLQEMDELNAEKDNEEENNSNLRKFILENFELTKDTADYMSNAEITEIFLENEFGDISKKKIAIELKSLGLCHRVKKIKRNGITKAEMCWFGLAKKMAEEEG